jgi:hypothetical protein
MNKTQNNKIAERIAKEIHPALNIQLDVNSKMSKSEIKELLCSGLGAILSGSK